MSDPNAEQVALLIDLENLCIPFERKKNAPKVSIHPIVEFLEDNFGPAIIRRAYADWGNSAYNGLQGELQDLGVEMIHVRKRTARSKKNGADILLTADAVETLLLRPFIRTFALVSGDSDIGPLITKLKSHGKTVVVVGPDKRSTARHVIELADRFKYYGDIASPPSTSRKRRTGSKKSPQRTVIQLLEKAGEGVESATLKRRLLEQPGFKGFSEKALGFKNWTAFLRSIDGVEVQTRSDLGIEIQLRGSKKGRR